METTRVDGVSARLKRLSTLSRGPLSFISCTIQSGPIHRMSFVRCQSPRFKASTKRQSCSPYKFVKMRSWSAGPPQLVFSTGSSFLGSAEKQRVDAGAVLFPRAAARARRARRLAERAIDAQVQQSKCVERAARAAQLSYTC